MGKRAHSLAGRDGWEGWVGGWWCSGGVHTYTIHTVVENGRGGMVVNGSLYGMVCTAKDQGA